MKKRTLCLLACLSTLLSIPQAHAQVYDLSDVVVTATRTKENIAHVPASVSVITADEIAHRPAQNISDILANLVSAYQAPTPEGGLSIRGFDSTEMLILLDNQPLNSGWNGSVEWINLPTDNIERIEVVRGAGSSLYGGRAVGAVINIITKKTTEKLSGFAQYSLGSHHSRHTSLHFQNKNKKWNFGLGYENRSTDGYPDFYIEKSISKQNSGDYSADLPSSARDRYIIGSRGNKASEAKIYHFQLGYAFDEDRHIQYQLTHSNRTYSYQNPFSFIKDENGNPVYHGIIQLPNKKTISIAPSDFLGYVGETEMDVHRLSYTDDQHQLAAHLGYTHYKKQGYSSANKIAKKLSTEELRAWNGPGGYSFYPSRTWNFDLHKTWQLNRHTLTAGFNYQREEFLQTRYDSLHWRDHKNNLSPYEYNGGRGTTWAIFVQDQIQLNDKLDLHLGTRFDHYRKSNGFQQSLQKDQWQTTSHSPASYTEWSPKLALEYALNDIDRVYFSYGHSFNPPILYKVYRASSSTIPNPDLKPETSNTWEIGWKHQTPKWSWNIAAFQTTTKDLILYETVAHSPKAIKQYINSPLRTVRKGVELEGKYQFNDAWSGFINYTWQQQKEDSIPLYYTPKHLLHFGIAYQHQKWQSILDATYVSARQAPDIATGVYQSQDAYFITTFTTNYQLKKGLTLQGQIYNLFNRQFFAGEAARERSYQLSLRYQF